MIHTTKMAGRFLQPQDSSDGGTGLVGVPESNGDSLQPVNGAIASIQDSLQPVSGAIASIQHLNIPSSERHIQQEVKHVLETYGKAIISQGVKSDHLVNMMEQILVICQKSEDSGKKQEEQIIKLMEGLRKKDITINQLQATVAVQEAEITRLQMDLSRLERCSYDGVLLVEIEDYMRKKNQARRGPTSFYTEEFFTDRHGYKMCARIYLNGDGVGKGTHLSIFFVIKKGNHDNYLKWPFQRRVTFTLVNQDGKEDLSDAFRPDATSSSFQKPRNQMNIASGCPMFVSHAVLENPREGFLRNNTICLKVTVDPHNR